MTNFTNTKYKYKAFGLVCESEIEIPAFLKVSTNASVQFKVQISDELPEFERDYVYEEPYCRLNESEFEYQVEGVANYFVKKGDTILIQACCEDWNTILLYFYSNCMVALLFQRNLIPFHVSGVIDPKGGVWLFAAPSGIGKSTTAIKLKEKGYDLFTDDTALVYLIGSICVAEASYPLIKMWKATLENQTTYDTSQTYQLRPDVEKFGGFFHESFMDEPMKVNGIIFIEEEGDQFETKRLKGIEGFQRLRNNVFRSQWINGMGKAKLQFELLSAISKTAPFWLAKRPVETLSYEFFAESILKEIICIEKND
ncbi:hypothetical protein [Algoriphagus boseongensis]|nr:hypothetical protein [Algoriphagus boseongensis]